MRFSEGKLIVNEAKLTIQKVKCSFSVSSEENIITNFLFLIISYLFLITTPECGFSARTSDASLTDSYLILISCHKDERWARSSCVCLNSYCLPLIISGTDER